MSTPREATEADMREFEAAMQTDNSPVNVWDWTLKRDESGHDYWDRDTSLMWFGWKLAKGLTP